MIPFPTFPEDRPHLIKDDTDAQALMVRLGVWETMKNQPKKGNLSVIMADTHPTHWCICVENRGHEDPNENGYLVIVHPKKHVDSVQAHMLVMQLLQGSENLTAGLFMPNPHD